MRKYLSTDYIHVTYFGGLLFFYTNFWIAAPWYYKEISVTSAKKGVQSQPQSNGSSELKLILKIKLSTRIFVVSFLQMLRIIEVPLILTLNINVA